MEVRRPQTNKGSGLGKLMGLGQTIAGIYTGNPMLIAGGVSSLGAQAGNKGAAQVSNGLGVAGSISSMKSGGDNPLARRSEQTQPSPDMIKIFQDAEQVMPTLPQDVRDEVGPAIFQSMTKMAQTIKNNPQYYNHLQTKMGGQNGYAS